MNLNPLTAIEEYFFPELFLPPELDEPFDFIETNDIVEVEIVRTVPSRYSSSGWTKVYCHFDGVVLATHPVTQEVTVRYWDIRAWRWTEGTFGIDSIALRIKA